MIHYGDRLAALVDGELDHDGRDRLLAHLTGCADCRTAVDLQRRLKTAIAAADAPNPSEALLRTLISMSEPGEPTPPARRMLAAPPATVGPAAPWAQRRGSVTRPAHMQRPVSRPSRRRVYAAATGAFSVTAVAAGLALAGGERPQPGPALTPPVDSYIQQHVQTGGQIFGDPGYTAVFGVGFGAPGR